jgi:hypothetical protein
MYLTFTVHNLAARTVSTLWKYKQEVNNKNQLKWTSSS